MLDKHETVQLLYKKLETNKREFELVDMVIRNTWEYILKYIHDKTLFAKAFDEIIPSEDVLFPFCNNKEERNKFIE